MMILIVANAPINALGTGLFPAAVFGQEKTDCPKTVNKFFFVVARWDEFLAVHLTGMGVETDDLAVAARDVLASTRDALA